MTTKIYELDVMTGDLLRVSAVLTVLGRAFGGEMSQDERPEEAELATVIAWASKVSTRSRVLANNTSGDHDGLISQLMDLEALLGLMGASISSDHKNIVIGDTVMSAYLDAANDCAWRALAAIDRDHVPDDLQALLLREEQSSAAAIKPPASGTAPMQPGKTPPRRRRSSTRKAVVVRR